VKMRSMTHSGVGRLMLFGTVGLSGFAPNLFVLFVVAEYFHVNYVLAAVIATQAAISWNFVLLDQFVYRQNRSGSWYRRSAQFLALNNLDLLLRIPMLAAMVELAHIGYMTATVITVVVMFALRYTATDWIIYRARRLVPAYLDAMATSKDPTSAREDHAVQGGLG